MEEFGKLILENILPLVITIITTYFVPLLKRTIEGWYHSHKVNIKNKYLAQILELCEQAVRHQYQIRIKELKARIKLSDGVSADEKAFIYSQAKEGAIATVKEIMQGFPKLVRDLFEDKVEHFIEATIPKVKAKDAGVPALNPTIPNPASS